VSCLVSNQQVIKILPTLSLAMMSLLKKSSEGILYFKKLFTMVVYAMMYQNNVFAAASHSTA
jgi:hypothetical protein